MDELVWGGQSMSQDRDWAFLKIKKLGDTQRMFLEHIVRCGKDGWLDGFPFDMGGPSAAASLIDGLVRKGVLRVECIEGRTNYVLVEGDPVPLADVVLPKPYIKVRREQVSMQDSCGKRRAQNVNLWLDPRGEVTFHIVLPNEVDELCHGDERTTLVDGGIRTACGATAAMAVSRAEAICLEFEELENGVRHDVIVLDFDCSDDAVQDAQRYRKTGLMFRYDRQFVVGHWVFRETPSGGIRRDRHLPFPYPSESLRQALKKEGKAIIGATPERLQALEVMRQQLAGVAGQFKEIVSSADFEALVDNGGHLLLSYRNGEGP